MTPGGESLAGRGSSIVQVVLSLGRGGLETLAVDLACGLKDRGYRPMLVALDEGGPLEQRLAEARIEYAILGGRRFGRARSHLSLARLLRQAEAQVVHTHMFAPLLHSLPAIKLARVGRVVHTEHSFEYLESRPSLRVALRAMSAFTQVFTVVGQRMCSYYLNSVGIAPDKLSVIVNGIDVPAPATTEDRMRIRAEFSLPLDGFLVGTAGRFAPEKNLGLLLRAASAARRRGVPIHLVLLGEGETRVHLEELARELRIADAVSFLGWREDVRRILTAVDVYVLTSISEGLPLAMLEGMAAELPVISTEVGDVPLLVHEGHTGFLIAQDDERALVERFQQLAVAPELRRRMGGAARDVVMRTYDRATMVQRYIDAYGT